MRRTLHAPIGSLVHARALSDDDLEHVRESRPDLPAAKAGDFLVVYPSGLVHIMAPDQFAAHFQNVKAGDFDAAAVLEGARADGGAKLEQLETRAKRAAQREAPSPARTSTNEPAATDEAGDDFDDDDDDDA